MWVAASFFIKIIDIKLIIIIIGFSLFVFPHRLILKPQVSKLTRSSTTWYIAWNLCCKRISWKNCYIIIINFFFLIYFLVDVPSSASANISTSGTAEAPCVSHVTCRRVIVMWRIGRVRSQRLQSLTHTQAWSQHTPTMGGKWVGLNKNNVNVILF